MTDLSLFRIYRTLDLIGSENVDAQNEIYGEESGTEPRYESDCDTWEQPVGNFPEPKFKIYMASYGGRLNTCRVRLTDYVDDEQLVLDYFYDYGDSGGMFSNRIVCSKDRISEEETPEIFQIWTALRYIATFVGKRQPNIVMGVSNGMVKSNVSYLYRDTTRQNLYWINSVAVTDQTRPPDIIPDFNQEIHITCEYLFDTVRIFNEAALAIDENSINFPLPRVAGPSRVDAGDE
jgi:hypothetical protein